MINKSYTQKSVSIDSNSIFDTGFATFIFCKFIILLYIMSTKIKKSMLLM